MTAVQKVEERGSAITDYSAILIDVIAQAARDSSVDIDKMERLIAMQERVEKRQAEVAFADAFADMQPQLPIITMNGQIVHKGQVISEFSDWPNINKAITPILHRFGFGISFRPAKATGPGLVAVTAILRHRKGHIDEATVEGPTDTSGAKNAAQSVGSSLSYYKRYGGVLILNLTIEGEDDDGSSSGPKIQHEAPRDRPFPQGPARNKTDLKAKGRELWGEIEACGDVDMLDILLNDNAKLIEQLKDALPSWWFGGQRDGEPFDGLGKIVEQMKRDFERAS